MISFNFFITIVESLIKSKKCSRKECCKQCRSVKFMGTMTIWPVQKHIEHHKNTKHAKP